MTTAVPPVVLDVRGLQCPLPILRAKKALNGMAPGTVLEVQATDPGAVADFRSFCAQTGHGLEHQSEADGVYLFRIRRA